MKNANTIKRLIGFTPFALTHIGDYVRGLHFSKTLGQLPIDRFKIILDAGCGSGKYALRLAVQYPLIQVIAVDIKIPQLSDQVPSNFSFLYKNLMDLDEHNRYDFIYSIDVLEHIPDNIKVIRNFHMALRQGGYLYLHMPNNRGTQRHIFPDTYFSNFNNWEKNEHIGEMPTLSELHFILEQEGFKVMKSHHTFGLLGRLAWEIDRVTDGTRVIKILLMPLLKTLAHIAVRLPAKHGDFLVLARKDSIGQN